MFLCLPVGFRSYVRRPYGTSGARGDGGGDSDDLMNRRSRKVGSAVMDRGLAQEVASKSADQAVTCLVLMALYDQRIEIPTVLAVQGRKLMIAIWDCVLAWSSDEQAS